MARIDPGPRLRLGHVCGELRRKADFHDGAIESAMDGPEAPYPARLRDAEALRAVTVERPEPAE